MYRCQICFDELGTNGFIACTPCGHPFCSTCLSHALRIQPVCPTCRSTIETSQGTLPLSEAKQLVTDLCRKWPARRAEIECLAPRPIRLFLDEDATESPPEGERDVVSWQQTRIAELTEKLGEAEKLLELAKAEENEELRLLRLQVKALERTTQAAVDRAWEKESELAERERGWKEFFDILARERVALEDAVYAKEKEVKRAKGAEERCEKDVKELRERIQAMDKREEEHLRRIGEAVHIMKKKEKRITRYKAALQLSREKERTLEAEVERLKASVSTSGASPKYRAKKRKPLEPLSPNSQPSDSALPPAVEDNCTVLDDNSLEVVSQFEAGDLDPSMDLLAGPRSRPPAQKPQQWPGAAYGIVRQRKLEKKRPAAVHEDMKFFLDPRGGLKKGVVNGMGRRVKART